MSSSYEQLTTGEIILAGVDTDKGAETIIVLLRDSIYNILLATGLTVPTDATAGYAKGCLFIDTNVVTGSSGLYENVGTTTSCNFDALGVPLVGELSLAVGSMLVGAGAGVATAIDAKADGAILIGNGTTVAAQTLDTDVTMTNTGTVTIANDAVTYAKMQNVSATDRLLGRDTAAAGNVEELTLSGGLEFTGTGGIRIADDGVIEAKLDNNLLTKGLRCQPALADDDRFVTVVAAKATAYTIANASPTDGLCRNVSVTHATVDDTDTFTGGFLITGTNYSNAVISETIVVSADGVAYGTYAFKTVTAVLSAGWTQGGATADNIKVGFGPKVGMPFACNNASGFMLCTLDTAVIPAPTVAISSNVHLTTVDASSGTYDGTKWMTVIFSGV